MATDPRTNALVITDVPEVFPQVEQIIAELDKKAPQILIEAQIVEINTDRVNELGIEWGGARGEMAYFAGPARLTDYGLRPGFFSGNQWKQFFPNTTDMSGEADSASGGSSASTVHPIFATGVESSKGVYYGVFSLAQLQAIFRALISKGEARYLGKPKIVAMNNKTSVITISRDAAVGMQSVVASAGGSSGSSTSGAERRRIGLMLVVTPQVNKEGFITLVVQPSYTDITPSAISTQGGTIYDPVSRGASTMVRVKNGQTVVIGGVYEFKNRSDISKIPFLGDVPVLGGLFKKKGKSIEKAELLIFVTPRVLQVAKR